MKPHDSHWLRLAFWLAIASPIVALAVVLTTGAGFKLALFLTLYMWVMVCVILALIALVGLIFRAMQWGVRAIRR